MPIPVWKQPLTEAFAKFFKNADGGTLNDCLDCLAAFIETDKTMYTKKVRVMQAKAIRQFAMKLSDITASALYDAK